MLMLCHTLPQTRRVTPSLAVLLLAPLLLLLAAPIAAEEPAKRKRVLLIGEPADGVHKVGTHEYSAGVEVLAACLRNDSRLQVDVVRAEGEWLEGPDLIRKADCVVIYVAQGGKWILDSPRRLEAFAGHAAKGGGLVAIHWAMGARDAKYIDGYLKLFGGCHGGPDRKYKVLDTKLEVVSPNDPITRGVSSFEIHDELYYRLKFVNTKQGLRSVLKAKIEGREETVAWAWDRPDKGRSFGFSGFHFHRNWRRDEYRRMMTQAVLWSLSLEAPAAGVDINIDEKSYAFPR